MFVNWTSPNGARVVGCRSRSSAGSQPQYTVDFDRTPSFTNPAAVDDDSEDVRLDWWFKGSGESAYGVLQPLSPPTFVGWTLSDGSRVIKGEHSTGSPGIVMVQFDKPSIQGDEHWREYRFNGKHRYNELPDLIPPSNKEISMTEDEMIRRAINAEATRMATKSCYGASEIEQWKWTEYATWLSSAVSRRDASVVAAYNALKGLSSPAPAIATKELIEARRLADEATSRTNWHATGNYDETIIVKRFLGAIEFGKTLK